MEDEEVVALLREIRDLQKLHIEDCKEALRTQQTAIDMQTKAVRFQRRSLSVLGVVALLALAIVVVYR